MVKAKVLTKSLKRNHRSSTSTFASTYTGKRIAYVSGGPLKDIYNLVDEDPTTTYGFPSDEECIIIDMRKETQVRTFTAHYKTQVDANMDRHVQIFDDLERRFAIYRFVPDQISSDSNIQNALYQPNGPQFQMQRAQAGPGISFGQIEVIGDM